MTEFTWPWKTNSVPDSVVSMMQTRADLYKYLDYHAYEEKLDALFARGKQDL